MEKERKLGYARRVRISFRNFELKFDTKVKSGRLEYSLNWPNHVIIDLKLRVCFLESCYMKCYLHKTEIKNTKSFVVLICAFVLFHLSEIGLHFKNRFSRMQFIVLELNSLESIL